MRSIAVNIRGQYREWEKSKHSLFNMFDFLNGEANVVYFFTTWETSYHTIGNLEINKTCVDFKKLGLTVEDISKSFGDRQVGGVQILSPEMAKKMVPARLPEEYDQIMFVRYAANELKKKYEIENEMVFDMVVETRPDLFFVPVNNRDNMICRQSNPLHNFEILVDNPLQRENIIDKSKKFATSVFVNDLMFVCNSFTADLLNLELVYAMEKQKNLFYEPLAHDRVLEHMFYMKMVPRNGTWRFYADVEIIRPDVIKQNIDYKLTTKEMIFYVRRNRMQFDKVREQKMLNLKANLVIPMAGHGSRFATEGYENPKPFIDVNGKPMIERVVEHLGLQKYAKHIFICQTSHLTQERRALLKSLADDVEIIEINHVTQGAAMTVLHAEVAIKSDAELFIVNSDQLITWDLMSFLKTVDDHKADAAILCFKGEGTNWSYARTDKFGVVVEEVAEKKQISNDATAGLYYFSKGSYFVNDAKQMIANNERTNNEFYVAPVYNQTVKNHKVVIHHCDGIVQLGTPPELEAYLSDVQNN
jgi:UDP-N-acetylglucosamine diphosphorylase / glucose-1-phosphate thymidylyltransferase / UDP-N-acetylgalactosamine diphosphorylase / glucosamine-1-phosphate N-acetyltransferase / galactosamine-1-phosphate N-acetyltransferase